MDIGKFYGFSAPLSLMANLSKGQLDRLVGLLNSNVDRDILKGFLTELNHLEDFLENVVQVEYINTEDKRLGFEVRNAKNFYETGSSIKPPTLTQEELREKQAYLSTRPKAVARRMRVNGKFVDITPEMATVIQYFLDKLYMIKMYKDSITLNTTTEVVALGERLYLLQNYSASNLYWRITETLESKKNNESLLKSTLENMKTSVDTIKRHMVYDDSNTTSKEDISKFNIAQLQSFGYISSEDVALCEILDNKRLLKNLDREGLQAICSAYKIGNRLDIDFMNQSFGLDLDKDGYYKLFEQLCNVGLVGLNLYFEDFFMDMLDSASFTKEVSIVITKDKDLFRVTLELEMLLDTQLPFGGELD